MLILARTCDTNEITPAHDPKQKITGKPECLSVLDPQWYNAWSQTQHDGSIDLQYILWSTHRGAMHGAKHSTVAPQISNTFYNRPIVVQCMNQTQHRGSIDLQYILWSTHRGTMHGAKHSTVAPQIFNTFYGRPIRVQCMHRHIARLLHRSSIHFVVVP